jgi:hypothetical protein
MPVPQRTRSRMLWGLMKVCARSAMAARPGVALVALSGCARAPSHSAIEDAVRADLRPRLAQLGNSALAQFSGESRELKELAANQHLRVKVTDQKCNPIGTDKFRCDVLLDLHARRWGNAALLNVHFRTHPSSRFVHEACHLPYGKW